MHLFGKLVRECYPLAHVKQLTLKVNKKEFAIFLHFGRKVHKKIFFSTFLLLYTYVTACSNCEPVNQKDDIQCHYLFACHGVTNVHD